MTIKFEISNPTAQETAALAALAAALGGTAPASSASETSSSGSTATVNSFPADPGSAPFPSPDGSASLILNGKISGAPYLRSKSGAIYQFALNTSGAPIAAPGGNRQPGWEATINGNPIMNAGSPPAPIGITQLLERNGGVYFQIPSNAAANWGYSSNDNPSGWTLGALPAEASASGSASASNIPPPSPAAPSLASPPSPSTATGTLSLSAVAAGGTVNLPPGTIVGASTIGANAVINGAGMGKTIISGTGGIALANGKGLLVPLPATAVTIANLTLQDASCSDNNGAGVRDSLNTDSVSLYQVEITGCQDGILSIDSDWNLLGCNVHDNGAGDGLSHNHYFGSSATAGAASNDTINMTNGVSSNCNGGHEVKTRAGTTIISGYQITTGGSGSCVDCPQAGLLSISNSTLTLPKMGATPVVPTTTANYDRNFITYANENNYNAGIGQSVVLNGVVLNDESGLGGIIECNASNAPNAVLTLINVTYVGPVAPTITGFSKVVGSITPAPAAA